MILKPLTHANAASVEQLAKSRGLASSEASPSPSEHIEKISKDCIGNLGEENLSPLKIRPTTRNK